MPIRLTAGAELYTVAAVLSCVQTTEGLLDMGFSIVVVELLCARADKGIENNCGSGTDDVTCGKTEKGEDGEAGPDRRCKRPGRGVCMKALHLPDVAEKSPCGEAG